VSRRPSPFRFPWVALWPVTFALAGTPCAQQAATTPAASAAPAAAALDPRLLAALDHKAHGREDLAAREFAAMAQECAATAAAADAVRLQAEVCAAVALMLQGRCPVDRELPQRVLALRETPLARSDAAFADQVGVLALDYLIATGADDAPRLARQLAFVDDCWICGPFDNERGAALQRDLPAEHGFDPAATFAGKQRPVGWRRLTGAAPLGRLWLGAVLRPNQQVACLVATALVAERDTTVALHLGSAGSHQVAVNGAVVGRRDVDRGFAFDQDAVALPLRAGANWLVVKFCHQETGDFLVSLRLSALDGGPAAGVTVAAEPAPMQAAVARAAAPATAPVTTPAAPAGPPPQQGGRTRIALDAAHGLDALWLGTLFYLRSCDGENDRRDRRLAERAVADLPELPQARLLLAATRVRNVRVAAELDDNARRADYEAILALDPRHVEAAVLLGQLLLQGTGLRRDAEALARRALAVAPTHEPSRLLLADVLRADDLGELARREAHAAAAAPGATPASVRAALRAQDDVDQEQREQLLQRLLQLSGDPDDRLQAIRSQLAAGRVDAAQALLEHLQAREPLLRRCFELRADLAESKADLAGALREYGAWLQLCPDDDDALAAQSRLHGLLGHRDEQIETLRAAIECNPNRRDDQRYLEYLAAEATPFYADLRVDTAPLRGQPTPAAATAGKDPVYHLLRQRVVKAHKNGTTSEYVHECVRILTDAGARAFASYRLAFFGGEQRARLLSCTVFKADGSQEQPRLRGASVELQSLRPGDTFEVEGRIDDTAPTFFGDYFGLVHYLGAPDGAACQRSELVVLAEPGRDYRCQLTGGAPAAVETTTAAGDHSYAFRLDDLPRDVPEPYRPAARERVPVVRFTTFRDWDHFASWWWNLIRGQLETTPAMQQRVRELTAGCTTQEQRVAAIYHFVTTDVRYEAWEFGVHGYKPYSTAVIYERRHGDCKDKALLLCALLAEVGVRADPVLIFADDRRSNDDLSLPMVQHFNHCIAWLPDQDGLSARFLDGTAIWHPPTTIPEMDQGADVLVVDAGRALLRRVPLVDPAQNQDALRLELDLAADGSAHVRKIDQPTGNAAVALRESLGVEPARRRDHVERTLVSMFGPVAIKALTASDPLRLDEPVRLQVDFDVATLGQRNGREWQLPTAFGDDPLFELASEPERHSPLLLGVPRQDARVLVFRLPPGYRSATLPAAVKQQAPFGSLSVDWRSEGDQIVVARTVELTAPRIEPADYATFRDFVAALRAADAQRLVLQPENGR